MVFCLCFIFGVCFILADTGGNYRCVSSKAVCSACRDQGSFLPAAPEPCPVPGEEQALIIYLLGGEKKKILCFYTIF